ncbi:hypothetical protein IWZ03DRAFT_130251 [Phyllosticta citriasiana]|uniref:Uncharacterized protein n=1 Tax=Phyllosticta citriasiana TaxID=595635 RepID=A0ABR1KUA6_9PEZI
MCGASVRREASQGSNWPTSKPLPPSWQRKKGHPTRPPHPSLAQSISPNLTPRSRQAARLLLLLLLLLLLRSAVAGVSKNTHAMAPTVPPAVRSIQSSLCAPTDRPQPLPHSRHPGRVDILCSRLAC